MGREASTLPTLKGDLPMLRPRRRLVAMLPGAALLAALATAPAVHAATTLYVGTGGGPGSCASPTYATIAAAVAATNPGDTVHVCAGTYALTATVVVPRDLSFVGDGAATTIVDGANGASPVRLFDAPMVSVSFTGLTLRNGWSTNGGAVFAGSVAVTSSTLSGNSATTDGGAIYAEGPFTAINSTFSGNSASSYGGAIYTRGAVTITNSTLSGNSATSIGGAVYAAATATATGTTFSSNTSRYGGAIFASISTAVTSCTFSGNSATAGGGAIDYGNVTATSSTFSGNSALSGGAISTMYVVTVTGSTFTGNSATTYYGGAILGFRVTATNSTFSGNAAAVDGGAIHVYSPGGSPATVTATNSTFSGNMAPDGSAIHSTSGTSLANTIVSGTGAQCAAPLPVDLGGNLVTDVSCPGTATTAGALALSPLASNGGPTQTMALGATSLAIGMGVDATCADAPVSGLDQRGIIRPQGAHCDVGAFERVAFDPVPTIVGFSPMSGRVGSTVNVTGSNLTSVNGVTFNGVPARFSVRSPSVVVATVPAGATTGPIRVTTRFLTSAQSAGRFFVLP